MSLQSLTYSIEPPQTSFKYPPPLNTIVSLGDIFICVEKVFEQANEYGHSPYRECAFLITHGILHLLGYDHMEKEDEVVMFGLQDEILNELEILR